MVDALRLGNPLIDAKCRSYPAVSTVPLLIVSVLVLLTAVPNGLANVRVLVTVFTTVLTIVETFP